jgi:two-component system sensor histidine kinase AlgZ
MSRNGAIRRGDTAPSDLTAGREPGRAGVRPPRWRRLLADALQDDFFLPDFCAPRMVLAVVLISELLAAAFTLARPSETSLLTELARTSLFLQWLGLTGAAALCYARRPLARLSVPLAATSAFLLVMTSTALVSAAAVLIGHRLSSGGFGATLFPADGVSFLLRNEGICAIVVAMLLRYFFVAHQWRHHVRAEARSRIHALQARMRPHFLFNSMNTIASLTRTDPPRAEEAVEDLADLFRATLQDSENLLRLKEELELTRIYQRIEQLRLGERLRVDWQVESLPMRALLPGLTVQPLLENAIYHGVEPLPAGGTVTIAGHLDGDELVLSITNPVAEGSPTQNREGNRLALDNIRQRLQLAYGEEGSMEVVEGPSTYRVTLRFPYEE